MQSKNRLLLVQVLGCLLLLASFIGGPRLVIGASPRIEVVSPIWTRFEPTAETWTIPIGLLTTDKSAAVADVKAVRIDGMSILQATKVSPSTIAVNNITGLSQEELHQWNLLHSMKAHQELSSSEMEQYSELSRALSNNRDLEGADIEVTTALLPFQIDNGKTYALEYDLSIGNDIITTTTEVAIVSIQTDPLWKPAELHVHSKASDGHREIADLRNIYASKGYNVLYLTDHVDLIPNYISGGRTGWDAYTYDANLFTTSSISVYPGAEVTAEKRKADDPTIVYHTDVLGYGITGITDLPNQWYEPQIIINRINGQSSYASATFAHPSASTGYPTPQFTVDNYRGMELMSGLQTNFRITSPPMKLWYEEQARILGKTTTYFPSARAGGDYHVFPAPIPDYVTYVREAAYNNKNSFDAALKAGKTTISQKGGLGYITLGESLPGDPPVIVSSGTQLSFGYWFRPAVSGNYILHLCDETGEIRVSKNLNDAQQGKVYTDVWPKSVSFTGGRKLFSLYIEGPDYVYSSPIIVRT